MPASQLPLPPEDDRVTPNQMVDELGVKLSRIARWWRVGLIPYWTAGRNVVLSRAITVAYWREQNTLRPGVPRGRSGRSEPNDEVEPS